MGNIIRHAEQIYEAMRQRDVSRAREARIYARKALNKDDYKLMEVAMEDLAAQYKKAPTYFK